MRNFLFAGIATLVGCETPPVELVCEKDQGGIVEGQIIAGQTSEVVAAELTVRGVAAQTEGHVIRRVVVAGVAAKNDGFNFEQWSAVVPIGVLAGLPAASAPDRVEVAAVAFDGCEREFSLGAIEVAVDRTPGVRVEQLALAVDFPGDEGTGGRFIPADGSASALVRIIGNPDARGAAVTLTTNVGTFEGVAAGNVVHLAGDGTADATATVFLTADRAQDAIVSAHAKTVTSPPLAIDVAGPPTPVPSTGTLGPGDTISVTVFTEGRVEACQATPAASLTVMSGTSNLMASPGASDTNGDGRVDITITADAALTSAAETTISCRDRYGQASVGVFRAEP